jgi:hypothetical protein
MIEVQPIDSNKCQQNTRVVVVSYLVAVGRYIMMGMAIEYASKMGTL